MDLPKLPAGYAWLEPIRGDPALGVAAYSDDPEHIHQAYYDPKMRYIRHYAGTGWRTHTTDVSMEEAIAIMEQLVLLGEL